MNRTLVTLIICGFLIGSVCACSNKGGSNTQDSGSSADIAQSHDGADSAQDSVSGSDALTDGDLSNDISANQPFEILTDQKASDGCVKVVFHVDQWKPLYTAYNGGSDPFFQIHDQEVSSGMIFNMELYTVYGSGWTGQLGGPFSANCTTHGICVWFFPTLNNKYLASAGEVTVTALAHESGTLKYPVDITLENITLSPQPADPNKPCYHIEKMRLYKQ